MAQAKILPEAFVVSKQKGLVFPDRTTERAAKFIASKRRDLATIKEILGVQRAISQKFIDIAVQVVGARSSNDVNLGSGTLAVLRTICVLYDGKLAYGIHPQKLSAHSS